jgi:hypothetical protein
MMSAEKDQLVALINDYKAAVATAVTWLNAKSAREPGFQARPGSLGSRAGFLDEARLVRYQTHGPGGCWVITPEREVDFNFGPDGRCDGLDTWFVFDFLDSNAAVKAKYPLLTSGEQLVQVFQALEEEGLVAKNVDPSHESTYYLTADLQEPSPLRGKFYPADENAL